MSVWTFELGKSSEARVWLDELPAVTCPVSRRVTRSYSTRGPMALRPRKAALELFMNYGPRQSYGLIGGELAPSDAGKLEVSLDMSPPNGPMFINSLMGTQDEVRIGLPEDYAEGVLAGVEASLVKVSDAAPGRVALTRAAHGRVASNIMIFKCLASALLELLNLESGKTDPEQLRNICARNLELSMH